MRLDRFISNNTAASRSDVRQLLKSGAVLVNGAVATSPAMQVGDADHVQVHDTPVQASRHHYFMLHKPAGYVCANTDSNHPTVFDLLDQDSLKGAHLQIAGRLDLDTTGLLLLTTNGQWNHRLTSPRRGCCKVYDVTLEEPFDTSTTAAFAKGIQLDGERKATRPAGIEVLNEHRVRLSIHEGKYHQVKRMFAATGNHVKALHRLSVGAISLDPALEPGQFRALTPSEIASVDGARQATP